MAGFLGINKKNLAGGTPKPTAPIKPTIKPVAKTPTAPVVKPTVKTPVASKAAVKPVVKPIVKPPVTEQKSEESIDTTAEVVEEVVTLAPTAVENVTEEIKEVTPQEEPNTDEVIEEMTITKDTEETVEPEEKQKEEKAEKTTTKTDDIPEGYTEEEWLALSPQKRGAINRKLRQDNQKRKEAVEIHKEELGLKDTPVEAEYVPEKVPTRSEIPYEEVVASIIISSAGAEWDKQVAELTAELKSITIEPDMNTATMKHTMSELVALKDTVWLEATSSKTVLDAVKRKIDMVSMLNATKGSSTDERKANALKACMKHTENGMTINLYELLDVASAKHNFYSELVKQIEFKAKSLITMNGALKLEKDALGQI